MKRNFLVDEEEELAEKKKKQEKRRETKARKNSFPVRILYIRLGSFVSGRVHLEASIGDMISISCYAMIELFHHFC